MSKIVLEGVTKTFGATKAVDNLSLEIASGQFFSLLGPSGCGKTTTMRLIAGLERPDSGKIWIGEQLVFDSHTETSVAPARRQLGMVFQNYALWPHMTVGENILFGLQTRKVPRAEQQQRLSRILDRMHIQNLAGRYPNELSGGQQQRVALARELVTGARILLMDEPLSNLDAKLRIDMRVELKQLHEETGVTIIYVTHDQGEALTLSSRIAVMNEGLCAQVADPQTVFELPSDLFVASFIGEAPINLVQCEVSPDGLVAEGFRVPIPPQLSSFVAQEGAPAGITIGIRPADIELLKEPDSWSVPVKVESVLPNGYFALVRVSAKGLSLTSNIDTRRCKVGVGEELFARLSPEAIHCFQADGRRIGR